MFYVRLTALVMNSIYSYLIEFKSLTNTESTVHLISSDETCLVQKQPRPTLLKRQTHRFNSYGYRILTLYTIAVSATENKSCIRNHSHSYITTTILVQFAKYFSVHKFIEIPFSIYIIWHIEKYILVNKDTFLQKLMFLLLKINMLWRFV